MPDGPAWSIVEFDKAVHDRQGFSCGVAELDHWLHRQAAQAQKRHLANVWVVTPQDDPALIAGYYSLAPCAVDFVDAPPALRRRLPHYPLHCALLARLAVSLAFRGRKLGALLVADALLRSRAAAATIPLQALVVHAKDETAARFYRHLDFLPFDDHPRHLFVPL